MNSNASNGPTPQMLCGVSEPSRVTPQTPMYLTAPLPLRQCFSMAVEERFGL